MSYLEAFQIGWSILWRKVAWLIAAAVVLLLVRESAENRSITAATGVALGLVLFLYIFPGIIRGLPAIEYRDFRLELHRSTEGPARLTWPESMILLISIYLINGFLSIPLLWILRETYQFVVILLYPFVVAGPLAAYVLENFPSQRFGLEVAHGSRWRVRVSENT